MMTWEKNRVTNSIVASLLAMALFTCSAGFAPAGAAVAPPVLKMQFASPFIFVNDTVTLGFDVTNPGDVGLTGVAFTDTLPTGLVVAAPPTRLFTIYVIWESQQLLAALPSALATALS